MGLTLNSKWIIWIWCHDFYLEEKSGVVRYTCAPSQYLPCAIGLGFYNHRSIPVKTYNYCVSSFFTIVIQLENNTLVQLCIYVCWINQFDGKVSKPFIYWDLSRALFTGIYCSSFALPEHTSSFIWFECWRWVHSKLFTKEMELIWSRIIRWNQ